MFPATVVGKPRQEDFFIGDLLQELLSPLFPLVMPAVQQLWSYGETGYHSLAAAVVKQRYAARGDGQRVPDPWRRAALADQVPARDRSAGRPRRISARRSSTCWRARNPETDLYVFSNLSMDTLDYSGPEVNKGSKGVWLGLGDPVRELPRAVQRRRPAAQASPTCACSAAAASSSAFRRMRDEPDAAARIAASPGVRRLAAGRADRRACARGEERDELPLDHVHPFRAGGRHSRRGHARRPQSPRRTPAPILIDARMKPWYPKEVSCRPDVAETVSRRWREYFPGGRGVEMGDSERGHLD